ncbi:MAG TPA: hypothetical protein EYN67_08615 [Flavobacteriales bacterium]|nr:hypothetical protein [Flavobacteriales bacterium]
MALWYDTLTAAATANSINSAANLYRGECAVTASSTMIGKKIVTAIVPLMINASSQPLSGNVTFGIYNSSGVLQETTGVVAANTITGSKANYTFTGSGGSYVIQEGDFIMVGFTTEPANQTIEVYGTDGQEYDGQDSRRAYYESGTMQYTGSTTDFVMSLNDAGAIQSSSTLLPPPPAYVRL